MFLNKSEYKVLTFIARKTNMDCWFCIRKSIIGHYVYDLENEKCIPLRNGIKQLIDGMTDVDWNLLSPSQLNTLGQIFVKFL